MKRKEEGDSGAEQKLKWTARARVREDAKTLHVE